MTNGSGSALPGLCGNGVCDPGESCSTCARDCLNSATGRPCARVGIMYSVWHYPMYVGWTRRAPEAPVTVEDLLRSGRPLSDAGVDTFNQFYHSHAAGGIYCIVHRRAPGDLLYNPDHEGAFLIYTDQADCPDYAITLARHAQQLADAGVDFIAVDATNLYTYTATSDSIQTRPFQVILEEWSKLRAAGMRTPDVAMWQRLPPLPATPSLDRANMLPYVLDLYNAPEYDGMFLKTHSGDRVLFYADVGDFDPGFVTVAAENNGLKGIAPTPMWVNGGAAGAWQFMSFCQGDPAAGALHNALLDDAPCNQDYTPIAAGTGGSVVSVSPSYQLTYACLPFRSVGVYRGITLKKQFETVFRLQPDYVFISSWNEMHAQLVPPTADPGVCMGLEDDASTGGNAFVDMHGVEFLRDLEPSAYYGSFLLDLLASCLRVFRSGLTTCSATNELCCQGASFSSIFQVFSDVPDFASQGFVHYVFSQGNWTQPFYRCGGSFSLNACTGAPFGWLSTVKGGETLRALWPCGVGTCGAGDALGYVR